MAISADEPLTMVGLDAMETTIDAAELGPRMAEARVAARLGVRQVAKASGVPVRRLRALEAGEGTVSHGEVAAVAQACGVDPTTLFATTDELVVVLHDAGRQLDGGTIRGEAALDVVLREYLAMVRELRNADASAALVIRHDDVVELARICGTAAEWIDERLHALLTESQAGATDQVGPLEPPDPASSPTAPAAPDEPGAAGTPGTPDAPPTGS